MNMKIKNGLSGDGTGVDSQVKTLDGWVGGFEFLAADTGQKIGSPHSIFLPLGRNELLGVARLFPLCNPGNRERNDRTDH